MKRTTVRNEISEGFRVIVADNHCSLPERIPRQTQQYKIAEKINMPDIYNYMKSPPFSFAGLPVCTRLEDLQADIALVGIHCVSPYPQRIPDTRTAIDTAPDACSRLLCGTLDTI